MEVGRKPNEGRMRSNYQGFILGLTGKLTASCQLVAGKIAAGVIDALRRLTEEADVNAELASSSTRFLSFQLL